MRELRIGSAVLAIAAALINAGCSGSGSQTETAAPAGPVTSVKSAPATKNASAGTPGNKTKVAVLKVTGMT